MNGIGAESSPKGVESSQVNYNLSSFAVVFIISYILLIDPRFKTFNGKFFSYHGECDLVLMGSDIFADDIILHPRHHFIGRSNHKRIQI